VKPTGGRLDILLVRNIAGDRWEILSTGRYTGPLAISGKLTAEIHGGRTADLTYSGDLKEILWEAGEMPLPPYIRRGPNGMDKERYQTVYARDDGSIAAPTAGLHFTGELLAAIEAKGVLVRYLTLHVGKGTFAPIRTENVRDHVMEPEFFEIEKGLVSEIKGLKGRLVAVGTTATRAVEGFTAVRYSSIRNGRGSFAGSTDIFIYPGYGPGYGFRAVTSLVTNFHLPRSTPLMLASALCGRERLLAAYAEAVREKYRFFSYGDAMLIL
jgi:S-adenosylmethionine:tRNA ribosyltransferase-isomerase